MQWLESLGLECGEAPRIANILGVEAPPEDCACGIAREGQMTRGQTGPSSITNPELKLDALMNGEIKRRTIYNFRGIELLSNTSYRDICAGLGGGLLGSRLMSQRLHFPYKARLRFPN